MAETPKAAIVNLTHTLDDYIDGVRCAGKWDLSGSTNLNVSDPATGDYYPGTAKISGNTVVGGSGYNNISGSSKFIPLTPSSPATFFSVTVGSTYAVSGSVIGTMDPNTDGWEVYKGDKGTISGAAATAGGLGSGTGFEITLTAADAGNFKNLSPQFSQLQSQHQTALATYAAIVAGICNVTFTLGYTETRNNHAHLRWARASTATDATIEPTPNGPHPSTYGDTWIATGGNLDGGSLPRGSYAFTECFHEFLHGLGLKHPHDTTESPMPVMGTTHNGTGDASDKDSISHTIMSYRGYLTQSTLFGLSISNGSYPTSLMVYDVAALIANYGRSLSPRVVTTLSFNSSTGEEQLDGVGQGATAGNKIHQTWYGKIDTWDCSNFSGVTIDLRPGAWSTVSAAMLGDMDGAGGHPAPGNVCTPLDTDSNYQIRRVILGSGTNTITANARDNVFTCGGTTTANVSGALTDYNTRKIGSTLYLGDRRGSPEGLKTITGATTIGFSDGPVAVSAIPAGAVTRVKWN